MGEPAKKRRTSSRKKIQKSGPFFLLDRSKKEEKGKPANVRLHAVAISLGVLATFLLLSVVSQRVEFLYSEYSDGQFRNLLGPVGRFVGTMLIGSLGWSSLIPIFLCGLYALMLWREDLSIFPEDGARWSILVGWAGVICSTSAIAAIFGGFDIGGSVGTTIAAPLRKFLNSTGAMIVLTASALLFLSLATSLTVGHLTRALSSVLAWTVVIVFISIPAFIIDVLRRGWRMLASGLILVSQLIGLDRVVEWLGDAPTQRSPIPKPQPRLRRNLAEDKPKEQESDDDEVEPTEPERSLEEILVRRRTPGDHRAKKPVKSFDRVDQEDESVAQQFYVGEYEAPTFDLLVRGEALPSYEDDEELRLKSRLIETKLRDFNIHGKVTEVHPGPVITLFEFEPAAGIKVGRIANMSDDLAMTLKAVSVRIIAPIPGKGTVGIEVPNVRRERVMLRDVLESKESVEAESLLSVCLGKDVYGDPVVADIASMPHILIAGATGTGKSVCINAFLLSLLYRATPAELGLILIDPKILELSTYEGIPHLRVPVVTVPRQAKAVLEWAVNEMNRRYRILQKLGVRNIDSYNQVVRGEISLDEVKAEVPPPVASPVDGEAVAGASSVTADSLPPTDSVAAEREPQTRIAVEKLHPLPKIVIVIDELADLMLSVGREVEELITRLAQKARAAGIHLIVATQRPSVDVITGLIKANFPTRLSFQVVSKFDSRTILDGIGAEKLLGRGDMLLMPPGASHLKRIHGAFVSDGEVKKVVTVLKKNCKPVYDQHIMSMCEKALTEENANKEGGGTGEEEYDPLYDQAVQILVEKGQVSTSLIQRVFRIGYNRAARMVEVMEREGLVGKADGAKPRQLLVQTGQDNQ